MFCSTMVVAMITQSLLGVYFSTQSWAKLALEISCRTAKQMRWQHQQLLWQQEEIQQWWKGDESKEEEDTKQLVLEDQFLGQLHTMQHHF